MSGSCKHLKRCGLLWLRLLYIFLNKIYKKNNNNKKKYASCPFKQKAIAIYSHHCTIYYFTMLCLPKTKSVSIDSFSFNLQALFYGDVWILVYYLHIFVIIICY